MTISRKDVRDFTGFAKAALIGDDSVDICLANARKLVAVKQAENMEQEYLDQAILTAAGYLAYNIYSSKLERQIGVLPPEAARALKRYKEIRDEWLAIISSESPSPGAVEIAFQTTESLWQVR